jgi:hypothetical protein
VVFLDSAFIILLAVLRFLLLLLHHLLLRFIVFLLLLELGGLKEAVLFEDLGLHVGAEVEHVGELDAVVQFLVHEGVHVEDDSLHVQEEHVGRPVYDKFLLDVHCLLAVITLVAFYQLSRSQLFQPILYTSLIFDLQRQIKESLIVLINFPASLASFNGACLTTKDTLEEILLVSF